MKRERLLTWLTVGLLCVAVCEFTLLGLGLGAPVRAGAAPDQTPLGGATAVVAGSITPLPPFATETPVDARGGVITSTSAMTHTDPNINHALAVGCDSDSGPISPPCAATPTPCAGSPVSPPCAGAGTSIAGKVTNALGTPIAGAQLSAYTDACCGYGDATTAADGTYVITGLAPGTYRVQASGPYCPAGATSPPCVSYAGEYFNNTYDYGAATLVTATSGVTTPNIDFALAVGGSIAGKVTNALGTPIAGAQLSAYTDACCGYGDATTAADGTYVITGLAPGTYRVQASGPYCPAGATSPPCVGYVGEYFNNTYDYDAATLVTATSGVTAPNIDFALAVGGSIAGKVTNALGTPIAGAQVSADSDVCCGYGDATTAADGTYVVTGLLPGAYRVSASGPYCPAGAISPPCVAYASEYFNNTFDINTATLVTVTSGVTTPNIDFALAVGGSIAGKVTNALGTPIAGAQVSASSDVCCSGYGYATTGTDGRYVITGLAPGAYRVRASGPYCPAGAISPPCVAYASEYFNNTYDYDAATLVTVTSGVTTPNIDFALAVGGSIAGKVTNALGTPIAGAQVSAESGICCANATTGTDGRYIIAGVAPGAHRVYAYGPYCPAGATSPPCVSYAGEYFNNTYDYNTATLVTVTSGVTTPNIDFALAPGCTQPTSPPSAGCSDTEGDGIIDPLDNCLTVANTDQANFDADGIGNGPGIPGDDTTVASGDTLGDACDPDIDNDALANGSDPDPGGDNTDDDNGNGNPAVGCYGGTDAADDGPSWDTNCNSILDGQESNALCTAADTGADADGDGLHDRWETCTWGTNPAVVDSDSDGAGDCREVMDMNGNGLVTNADALFVKRGVFGIIGKDGVFDINGNGLITNADALFITRAVFSVTPCQ